ncbi:hypothetical protein BKA69DRAFT_1167925 [Paraphysoderma sedebokerense]|nr:hypothetical protein BKA69DRAFT_1167925 [Paraphysoderma sedebokerense]
MKSMIVFFALVTVAFASPVPQQSNSIVISGNNAGTQTTTASVTDNRNLNGLQTNFINFAGNTAQGTQLGVLSTSGNAARDQLMQAVARENKAGDQRTAVVQSFNTASDAQEGLLQIVGNQALSNQENVAISANNRANTQFARAQVVDNLSLGLQSNLASLQGNTANVQNLGGNIRGNIAGQQSTTIEALRNSATGGQFLGLNIAENTAFAGKQVNSGLVSGNSAATQSIESNVARNAVRDCSSARTLQELMACARS